MSKARLASDNDRWLAPKTRRPSSSASAGRPERAPRGRLCLSLPRVSSADPGVRPKYPGTRARSGASRIALHGPQHLRVVVHRQYSPASPYRPPFKYDSQIGVVSSRKLRPYFLRTLQKNSSILGNLTAWVGGVIAWPPWAIESFGRTSESHLFASLTSRNRDGLCRASGRSMPAPFRQGCRPGAVLSMGSCGPCAPQPGRRASPRSGSRSGSKGTIAPE